MSPAERADVIVGFSGLVGQTIRLLNFGPDEPFGGGVPAVDFEPADPTTTGQVMQFRVTLPLSGTDTSTPPDQLSLPTPPKRGHHRLGGSDQRNLRPLRMRAGSLAELVRIRE
jgi:spore coat protein A, manganese oxidase